MSAAPSAASRSGRTGLLALAHRRSTLVGVSSPWSVVRSMHVMARSSHAACHSFLTVRRVGIVAARRSTALRLMRSARTRSRSRGIPGLRSGWVNIRSARWGEPAAGVAPAAGVGCSYRRLVSMAACNLRRRFLLRRIPLGLPFLGRLLGRRPPLRLLALRLGLPALRRWGGGGRRGGPGGAVFGRWWGRALLPPPAAIPPGPPPGRLPRGGPAGGRGGLAADRPLPGRCPPPAAVAPRPRLAAQGRSAAWG